MNWDEFNGDELGRTKLIFIDGQNIFQGFKTFSALISPDQTITGDRPCPTTRTRKTVLELSLVSVMFHIALHSRTSMQLIGEFSSY